MSKATERDWEAETAQQGLRLFISYKRNAEPDGRLAKLLFEKFSLEHHVFIDRSLTVGTLWAESIENEVRNTDFMIVLLSPSSVQSEMVRAEIEWAYASARSRDGRPSILPIYLPGVDFASLGYPLNAYIGHLQGLMWQDDSDTPALLRELTRALAQDVEDATPKPSADPRLGAESMSLRLPVGTIPQNSRFYVERRSDEIVRFALKRNERAITVQGPRQTGKSSLLRRAADYARSLGRRVVYLDLQILPASAFEEAHTFYKVLCSWVSMELELPDETEGFWALSKSRPDSRLFVDYFSKLILQQTDGEILLIIDEADRVFESSFAEDFFSLLRFIREGSYWERISFILAASAEPFLYIRRPASSPFNVSLNVELEDFTETQVAHLNSLYGSPFDKDGLRRLKDLVGGHPYLIQSALYRVASGNISEEEFFASAATDQGPYSDHLRRFLWMLAQDAALLEALQAIYRGDNYRDEAVTFRLVAAGLVRREGRFLRPRYELYAEYFRERFSALEQRALSPVLIVAQSFFEQAGVHAEREGEQGFRLEDVPGKLKAYAPLAALVTAKEPAEEDLRELSRLCGPPARRGSRAAVLVYAQPPDALARIKMAELRLRDRIAIIPIPLYALEQSLPDANKCRGLLAQYAGRYLPGADFFDDRNAIGDTLSFFGRGELLGRLQEELLNLQGVGLFGLRKSGKTSVLLQLGFALRAHPVVHCDLQLHGERERFGAQLFNNILSRLHALAAGRASDTTAQPPPLPTDAPASELSGEFANRVVSLAEELGRRGYEMPVVLMLDEMERVLPGESDSRERVAEFNTVFGVLRALCQERHTISLLVTDVHPDCNRISQWRQTGVASNPVYSFFKEVFLEPFAEEETRTMIKDIGQLMGRDFDAETLAAVHAGSGGHPYVARQLASLLCKRLAAPDFAQIRWEYATHVLTKPFAYSGVIKDYFGQNIWADLEKRRFRSAQDGLKLLACAGTDGGWVAEEEAHKLLRADHSENDWLEAVLWLEAVGLIEREEGRAGARLRVRVPLMSRWLRMNMSVEEERRWRANL
jgi:hypothetical protein